MNNSTQTTALTPDPKGYHVIFNPRLWSIRWKIRSIFFMSMLAALCVIIISVTRLQHLQAIKESNDKLIILQGAKSQFIQNYFNNLNNQIISFSTDKQTADALSMLTGSFMNIETDNYTTTSASDNVKMSNLLNSYYETEIIPKLEKASGKSINKPGLLPADNKQNILQYLYLAENKKPLGAKITIDRAEDASAYSNLHAQYHSEMLTFARKAGIKDIFLVDYKSGYVVYSLQKNPDFATNLFDGPYKNSALALAFKSAIARSAKGALVYTDQTLYMPALFSPVMFISTPVYSGSQLTGALIVSLGASDIDRLVSLDKDGVANARSLKSFIAGDDYKYRNNDADFLTNRLQYIRKLKRHSASSGTFRTVENIGSTALAQSVDPVILSGNGADREQAVQYHTETGEQVFAISAPLQIDNLNWSLVTQINKSEILTRVRRINLIILGIGVLLTALLYYFINLFVNSISKRIESIQNNLVSLTKGENLNAFSNGSDDEIGLSLKTIGMLGRRVHDASVFVDEMGKGNTEVDFESFGEQDQYGIALNNLKNNLILKMQDEQKRKEEDEIRNWTAHGVALFNDILRSDNNNLEKLTFNIIRNIIEYMSANQGGLFLMENEDGEKYLKLEAAYAYNRQKFLKKRIEIGEGLVGACVLEKKTTLVSKIPDNYIEITSGLGGSKPECLLIVPLKKDEDVLGVLELASFNTFKPHEVEFVEKITESIASALITVRLHLQTSQYLERFQQQAEEMKAQEEELRQNIEELQATHEQIERLKQDESIKSEKAVKELENYRKLLMNVLDQMPDKVFLKDQDGKLLLLNSAVSRLYDKTVEDMIGTTDFDYHTREEAVKLREKELEIIEKGADTYLEEESLSGELRMMKTTKIPFYIPHLGQTGILGYQTDVTELNNLEVKIQQLQAELKELRRNE
jgi:PAS domain S-box-containing protein